MRLPDETRETTPVDELFTYHIFGIPAQCREYRENPQAYRLFVKGLVDTPIELSLDRIRNEFEPVSTPMVLQCTTNIHWGRIDVLGARLCDVFDLVGVRDGAIKVVLRGADGFDTDLTVEEIRGQPDSFLLAYGMNGEPLTPDHGFPVRLASDGRYGYKWPKWLSEIELVDYDHKGHYELKRGWSDRGMRGTRVT